MDIGAGPPFRAALVETDDPYVLFDRRANQNYTVRIRFLSSLIAKNVAGDTFYTDFSDTTQLPLLPRVFHPLLVVLMGKILSGRLAVLRDPDGSFRYPGMQDAYAYFSREYDAQLKEAISDARRRGIMRTPPTFDIAGADLWVYHWGQRPR